MIICENLVKIYKTQETEVIALQGLELTVAAGEVIAIIGNSGSGKSTLLNMLGGLDKPSAGTLMVDGQNLLKFSEKDYLTYKRETVGFIWQNNARNLIPYLTALENVQVPMVIKNLKNRKQKAKKLLALVGLEHREKSKLNQLSGGEQQRVAMAISLANDPKVILADEPTGSVDTSTARHIMEIFNNIARELNVTVVIVTHDTSLAKYVDRVVAIRDGRTSSEFIRRISYRDELSHLSSYEEEELSHVELALVDNSGRVQIPQKYLDSIGIKGKSRVKIESEEGKIVIISADDEKLANMKGDIVQS